MLANSLLNHPEGGDSEVMFFARTLCHTSSLNGSCEVRKSLNFRLTHYLNFSSCRWHFRALARVAQRRELRTKSLISEVYARPAGQKAGAS
jgi:hypothetical protein